MSTFIVVTPRLLKLLMMAWPKAPHPPTTTTALSPPVAAADENVRTVGAHMGLRNCRFDMLCPGTVLNEGDLLICPKMERRNIRVDAIFGLFIKHIDSKEGRPGVLYNCVFSVVHVHEPNLLVCSKYCWVTVQNRYCPQSNNQNFAYRLPQLYGALQAVRTTLYCTMLSINGF